MEAYFDNSATTKVLDCVKDAVVDAMCVTASYEKVHVNPQKKLVYILQMSVKALLLHPLSGTKAAMF